ncbi:MAG TPA: YceI family protein [Vicinamibacterales bacterium]|nr:YceI family protein [Vicinamibacterales bacterium]
MTARSRVAGLVGSASVLVVGLSIAALAGGAQHDITLQRARVTIAGTSNIHDYTASTADVRIVRLEVAGTLPEADPWGALLTPGTLQAFEVAIPAASLSSPREGLDKNMHKALKVKEHPMIAFRLARLQPAEGTGAFRAEGMLTVAGVERAVVLDLIVERQPAGLIVRGGTSLLMTDFGIAPPRAMLGLLRTDPKVTVRFELVLGASLT